MGQNVDVTLSPRQRECLEGVAEHLDSVQIGERLGISPHTVDGHIAAAVATLGARSRRDAVRIWQENKKCQTGEKLTGEIPPVDFPIVTPPSQHGSEVREARHLRAFTSHWLNSTGGGDTVNDRTESFV